MKTFKGKLDAYGADFSRWEGADVNEARAFMEASAEAQALHARTAKLDKVLEAFSVEAPGRDIMGGIDSRIGSAATGGAKVMPFPLRIETPSWKVATGMGLAAAAVVMLFVFSTVPDVAITRGNGEEQIENFVSEMASLIEEDVQADEVFGLLEVAQAAPAADAEYDVDSFLDELYAADEEHMVNEAAAPEVTDEKTDEDIWEMFYPGADTP